MRPRSFSSFPNLRKNTGNTLASCGNLSLLALVASGYGMDTYLFFGKEFDEQASKDAELLKSFSYRHFIFLYKHVRNRWMSEYELESNLLPLR